MDEFIKPKIDVVFKKMFADNNNKGLLIDLLASLLDINKEDVKDVKVTNPEITPDMARIKFSRLDILLITKDRSIDLEMQTTDSNDFVNKELVYWAKMCSQDLEKGQSYGELRQNISISILDFDHDKFKHNDYTSLYTLYDQKHNQRLTNKCAFFFFELHKLRNLKKDISQFSQKELWLKLINSESKEELDMLKKINNSVINEAVSVVNNMSNDPAVRELARIRYFAEHEEASRMQDAMNKGRAEEKAKHEAEMAAISKAMRESGMTEEQINSILNGQPF